MVATPRSLSRRLPRKSVAGPLCAPPVDDLASACGGVVPDPTAAVLVDPSQLQTPVLQRSLELGLRAAVAIVNQAGEVLTLAPPDRHLQRIEARSLCNELDTRQKTLNLLKTSVTNAA